MSGMNEDEPTVIQGAFVNPLKPSGKSGRAEGYNIDQVDIGMDDAYLGL